MRNTLIKIFISNNFIGDVVFSSRAQKLAVLHSSSSRYPNASLDALLNFTNGLEVLSVNEVLTLIDDFEHDAGKFILLMEYDYDCIYDGKKVLGNLRVVPIDGKTYCYSSNKPRHCELRRNVLPTDNFELARNDFIDLRVVSKIICENGVKIESRRRKVRDPGLSKFLDELKRLLIPLDAEAIVAIKVEFKKSIEDAYGKFAK